MPSDSKSSVIAPGGVRAAALEDGHRLAGAQALILGHRVYADHVAIRAGAVRDDPQRAPIGFGAQRDQRTDGLPVHTVDLGGEGGGDLGGRREGARLVGHDVVEGEVEIPEREPVVGLEEVILYDETPLGAGIGAAGLLRVGEEGDLGGRSIGTNDVQVGPIDGGVLRRIKRHQPRVMNVKLQRQAGEIGVGKVLQPRVFVEVVGVVQDKHGKVRRIAEYAADLETRRSG